MLASSDADIVLDVVGRLATTLALSAVPSSPAPVAAYMTGKLNDADTTPAQPPPVSSNEVVFCQLDRDDDEPAPPLVRSPVSVDRAAVLAPPLAPCVPDGRATALLAPPPARPVVPVGRATHLSDAVSPLSASPLVSVPSGHAADDSVLVRGLTRSLEQCKVAVYDGIPYHMRGRALNNPRGFNYHLYWKG